MIPAITKLLSILTLALDVALVLWLLVWLLQPLKISWLKRVRENSNRFVHKHGLVLLFILSLAATAGSLFFSEAARYNPCRLCWYQRIFMYPQLVLVATALIRKSKEIVSYLIPLSVIGGLIAIYHYSLQVRAALAPLSPLAPCAADGTSCAARYIFQFGYITIPLMALSAFLAIIIISLIIKGENKNL